jgi:ribosome-binding factor A
MPGDGRRALRVSEVLRARLVEAMQRELSDPLLVSLVITKVELTDDLAFARIGVRLLVGDDDPKNRKSALRHLHRASGRLSRVVSPSLRLRKAPELRFEYDTGHDAERRVSELLHEIATEPKGRDE